MKVSHRCKSLKYCHVRYFSFNFPTKCTFQVSYLLKMPLSYDVQGSMFFQVIRQCGLLLNLLNYLVETMVDINKVNQKYLKPRGRNKNKDRRDNVVCGYLSFKEVGGNSHEKFKLFSTVMSSLKKFDDKCQGQY